MGIVKGSRYEQEKLIQDALNLSEAELYGLKGMKYHERLEFYETKKRMMAALNDPALAESVKFMTSVSAEELAAIKPKHIDDFHALVNKAIFIPDTELEGLVEKTYNDESVALADSISSDSNAAHPYTDAGKEEENQEVAAAATSTPGDEGYHAGAGAGAGAWAGSEGERGDPASALAADATSGVALQQPSAGAGAGSDAGAGPSEDGPQTSDSNAAGTTNNSTQGLVVAAKKSEKDNITDELNDADVGAGAGADDLTRQPSIEPSEGTASTRAKSNWLRAAGAATASLPKVLWSSIRLRSFVIFVFLSLCLSVCLSFFLSFLSQRYL